MLLESDLNRFASGSGSVPAPGSTFDEVTRQTALNAAAAAAEFLERCGRRMCWAPTLVLAASLIDVAFHRAGPRTASRRRSYSSLRRRLRGRSRRLSPSCAGISQVCAAALADNQPSPASHAPDSIPRHAPRSQEGRRALSPGGVPARRPPPRVCDAPEPRLDPAEAGSPASSRCDDGEAEAVIATPERV